MKRIALGLLVFTVCFLFTYSSFALGSKQPQKKINSLSELSVKAYLAGYKIEEGVLNEAEGSSVSSNTMPNRCYYAVKRISNSHILYLEKKCLQGAQAEATIRGSLSYILNSSTR